MNTFKKYLHIFKTAAIASSDDRIVMQSAALSYYTIFSIAPLILIAVAVAGLFFGGDASRGQIFNSISGLVGEDGAHVIESLVLASSLKNAGILATIIGVFTLLIGATSTFAQLQDSLNLIWKVKPKPGSGVWPTIRQRILSLSLVLIIGFLLLVSLVLSAVLSGITKYAGAHLHGSAIFWQILELGVSTGVTFVLFAAIYKILPDVKLKWKDVWVGSLMTTVLFNIGKFLIGLYLGRSGVASTYAAAGSVMVILIWTYYSSVVLLFGAEVTRFYTKQDQSEILLKPGAIWDEIPKDPQAESAAYT